MKGKKLGIVGIFRYKGNGNGNGNGNIFPVAPSHSQPHNSRLYKQLCDELITLSMDPTLHWRHADMAQSLLSLALRRDIPFPDEAVRMFFRLLVSDSLKTRKMALALVASWMKINKPKAKKGPQTIEIGQNNGAGAKWPIKYGIRKDNKALIYNVQKQPRTADEWNKTRWYSKVHWGFYTWPKEFKTYAMPSEQIEVWVFRWLQPNRSLKNWEKSK